ncbi:MAG: nucleosidase [Alphaproteobacteria bacterium]
MKPLLVFAMKEESKDVFTGYEVLHTGIGKVNAAYALTARLANNKPSIVINLGTAGSRKHKGGTIVNCTQFIQRDMDVTLLGFEKWQTPFSSDPVIIEHGKKIDGLTQGICGTGDNFDTSDNAIEFDAVDMEAYALALICARENIPFLCLKYISDGADDSAGKDWNKALEIAANSLKGSLLTIPQKDMTS